MNEYFNYFEFMKINDTFKEILCGHSQMSQVSTYIALCFPTLCHKYIFIYILMISWSGIYILICIHIFRDITFIPQVSALSQFNITQHKYPLVGTVRQIHKDLYSVVRGDYQGIKWWKESAANSNVCPRRWDVRHQHSFIRGSLFSYCCRWLAFSQTYG